ncbi:serine-rich adhesin for platelets-like isoform X2 [Sycon ciliatum]|uniref:serine-rich adhesin for platelets-like isoform X2 n=1 Tax=Sycon ciliatum TaxID=27933 RepID=UPI0031F64F5B
MDMENFGVSSIVDQHGTLNLSSRSLENKSLLNCLLKVDTVHMKQLLINNNSITHFPAGVYESVRRLNCSGNELTIDTCPTLVAFPNLEELKIKENQEVTKHKDYIYRLLSLLPKLRRVDGKDVHETRVLAESELKSQIKKIWASYFRKLLGAKPQLDDFLKLTKEHADQSFDTRSLSGQFKLKRFVPLAERYFKEKVVVASAAAASHSSALSSPLSSPTATLSTPMSPCFEAGRAMSIRITRTVASPSKGSSSSSPSKGSSSSPSKGSSSPSKASSSSSPSKGSSSPSKGSSSPSKASSSPSKASSGGGGGTSSDSTTHSASRQEPAPAGTTSSVTSSSPTTTVRRQGTRSSPMRSSSSSSGSSSKHSGRSATGSRRLLATQRHTDGSVRVPAATDGCTNGSVNGYRDNDGCHDDGCHDDGDTTTTTATQDSDDLESPVFAAPSQRKQRKMATLAREILRNVLTDDDDSDDADEEETTEADGSTDNQQHMPSRKRRCVRASTQTPMVPTKGDALVLEASAASGSSSGGMRTRSRSPSPGPASQRHTDSKATNRPPRLASSSGTASTLPISMTLNSSAEKQHSTRRPTPKLMESHSPVGAKSRKRRCLLSSSRSSRSPPVSPPTTTQDSRTVRPVKVTASRKQASVAVIDNASAAPRKGRKSASQPLVQAEDMETAAGDWKCTRLLRCHSENNSPDDDETSVFNVSFPESGGDVFASAGGNSVCVINAKSGQVLKKFKMPKETFFSVLWTTTSIRGKTDEHLLAASGEKGDIYILSMTYNVCFHVITSHTRTISSLSFMPSHPDLLAGSAGRFIQIHQLGTVTGDDERELKMKSTRVCNLTASSHIAQISISEDCRSLLAATQDDVEVWKFSKPWKTVLAERKTSDVLIRDGISHRKLSIYPDDLIVDSAVFLANNMFASRSAPCAGDLELCILDGKVHTSTLQYPENPMTDLRMSATLHGDGSSTLLAGDSHGAVHGYRVNGGGSKRAKSASSRKPADWVLQGPSCAALHVTMRGQYVVVCHADNLIAIWERSSPR